MRPRVLFLSVAVYTCLLSVAIALIAQIASTYTTIEIGAVFACAFVLMPVIPGTTHQPSEESFVVRFWRAAVVAATSALIFLPRLVPLDSRAAWVLELSFAILLAVTMVNHFAAREEQQAPRFLWCLMFAALVAGDAVVFALPNGWWSVTGLVFAIAPLGIASGYGDGVRYASGPKFDPHFVPKH